MKNELFLKNMTYWAGRAPGYSEVNQIELQGCQRENWGRFLSENIDSCFAGRKRSSIRVLDIGAGPGFLSIVLAEKGYAVTAADFTPAMLEQAKENSGDLCSSIRFVHADAQALPFENSSYDIVLSRNLTWNLQDPECAYMEWLRVLVPGGMLMVFDANWYSYLYDPEQRSRYNDDRAKVADAGCVDLNIGENFDIMEKIAAKLPLSAIRRPLWDVEVLSRCGACDVYSIENIGERLYSDEEKLNFSSTPMFLVCAKRSNKDEQYQTDIFRGTVFGYKRQDCSVLDKAREQFPGTATRGA